MGKRDDWKTLRQQARIDKESARAEFMRIDPALRREIQQDSRSQAMARQYDIETESDNV